MASAMRPQNLSRRIQNEGASELSGVGRWRLEQVALQCRPEAPQQHARPQELHAPGLDEAKRMEQFPFRVAHEPVRRAQLGPESLGFFRAACAHEDEFVWLDAAQLHDMLAAEGSAKVAEEHKRDRTLGHQRLKALDLAGGELNGEAWGHHPLSVRLAWVCQGSHREPAT